MRAKDPAELPFRPAKRAQQEPLPAITLRAQDACNREAAAKEAGSRELQRSLPEFLFCGKDLSIGRNDNSARQLFPRLLGAPSSPAVRHVALERGPPIIGPLLPKL